MHLKSLSKQQPALAQNGIDAKDIAEIKLNMSNPPYSGPLIK